MPFVVAAAVVGAAATIYSSNQASKAAKQGRQQADALAAEQAAAQKDSQAAQGRSASVEAQKARIQQAREARIRRGQIASAGGNAGLGAGTSGLGGAIGSVTSQAAENIGTINQQESFAAQASAANQRSADAGFAIARVERKTRDTVMNWQAIGNVAQTIFSTASSRIK